MKPSANNYLKVYVVWGIVLILLVWIGFIYFSSTRSATVEPLIQTTIATITCLNNSFVGDVLFVTGTEAPLEFRCRVEPVETVPDGYLPQPAHYQWSASSGTIRADDNQCTWSHPYPGLERITLSGTMKFSPPAPQGFFPKPLPELHARFEAALECLVPLKADLTTGGSIDAFEIGTYPNPTSTGDLNLIANPISRSRVRFHADKYLPPQYFYKVTPQTYHLRIFKNYTLGDFDLDPRFSQLDYPRYIAIDSRIITKLDLLHELIKHNGLNVSRFNIIYGFRSPAYNSGARQADGQMTLKEPFSIHMYGKALDFIIDEDRNFIMDDLNHDGRIEMADANVLLEYVNQLDRRLRDEGSDLVGGAGVYPHHDYYERGKYVQSPYVHMDVRGFTREDGTLIRWKGEDKLGVTNMNDPYRLKEPLLPHPISPR